MNLSLSISRRTANKLLQFMDRLRLLRLTVLIALVMAIAATTLSFFNDLIVSYGDAESHLNIAKRVVHSITPGMAQLGGIWLPIPHIMMVPLVYFDFLWRTGLAGSIVSGCMFVVSSIFIFKLALLLTKSKYAAFLGALVFILNPNILYLQSTPMTELPLVGFFLMSSYFFIRYILNEGDTQSLLLSAFFGFCAVLTRYDGWFLVLFEAATIVLLYLRRLIFFKDHKESWSKTEGRLLLFSTLAFFGVAIWMMWDFLILGDPFYFTNSQFSAKTQQMNWLKRGELPAYHNPFLAFAYYFVTSMSNGGVVTFFVAIFGIVMYLKERKDLHRFFVIMVLLVPFIFNVFTMFVGQSVIFIPHLTPVGFEWRLFNVRYGVLMIPVVALFFGYAFHKVKKINTKLFVLFLFLLQFGLYFVGYSKIITLADGTEGLSRAKRPDAEYWIKKNYDDGLVLLDDYARTLSIVRSDIPMQNIIYIGNKPYWEISLVAPERYAKWIIMQKDDDVWSAIYDKPDVQGRLFKYFKKVYTSPQILIFKRI